MAKQKQKRLVDPTAGTMTVGQAAKRIGTEPRAISDLLYALDPASDVVETIGRRRRIREVHIADITQALVNRGVMAPPNVQV